MPNYSDEINDVVVAASICPDCGTLAFAYRSTDLKRSDREHWQFICSQCDIDFAMPENELVFQSMRKEWLLAKVYVA
jgi:hypothetical protein